MVVLRDKIIHKRVGKDGNGEVSEKVEEGSI